MTRGDAWAKRVAGSTSTWTALFVTRIADWCTLGCCRNDNAKHLLAQLIDQHVDWIGEQPTYGTATIWRPTHDDATLSRETRYTYAESKRDAFEGVVPTHVCVWFMALRPL